MSERAMIATVPRLPPPAAAPRRRARVKSRTVAVAAYFVLLAAAFTALSLWLLSRNYVNDAALWSWSTVIQTIVASRTWMPTSSSGTPLAYCT